MVKIEINMQDNVVIIRNESFRRITLLRRTFALLKVRMKLIKFEQNVELL